MNKQTNNKQRVEQQNKKCKTKQAEQKHQKQ